MPLIHYFFINCVQDRIISHCIIFKSDAHTHTIYRNEKKNSSLLQKGVYTGCVEITLKNVTIANNPLFMFVNWIKISNWSRFFGLYIFFSNSVHGTGMTRHVTLKINTGSSILKLIFSKLVECFYINDVIIFKNILYLFIFKGV